MSSKPPLTFDLPFSGLALQDDDVRNDAQRQVLALFDTCAPGLLRYARSFGIGAAADDVVQEAFIALFRHVRLGRPQHNLKGWLFRVAHNLALKQRKRQRQLDESHGWNLVLAQHVEDALGSPEDQLAEKEWRGHVQRVFATLPDRDRSCVSLRAEGLSYRDIARVLGISLGSVAKSLVRSLERLGRLHPTEES